MRNRLCLYYIKPQPASRWFSGDQKLRMKVRELIRGPEIPSSLEMVFLQLCEGLRRLKVPFEINLPFDCLQPQDVVIMLGRGSNCLVGYKKTNPIIAGIGLMTHPAEWPKLFEEYPVKTYLQHSAWTSGIYEKYYGDRCEIWPVGIDTEKWKPSFGVKKDIDVLVYKKIMWDKPKQEKELLEPILSSIKKRGLSAEIITYGNYSANEYKKLLGRSRSMVFLCEHESQGLAYQEALAMNVPIFAWDQGQWLDPNRLKWGEVNSVPSTSVPYFNHQCGLKFKDFREFKLLEEDFFSKIKEDTFKPREFMLNNLTLERSAERMLEIVRKYTSY